MSDHPLTVVITGAGRGLGREVALQLSAVGHHVIITARDQAAAAQTATELGNGVTGLPLGLDISQQSSVDAAAGWLTTNLDRLDVLINNAAAYVDWAETVSTANLDAAHEVMETNVFGAWRVTQALLPLLRNSAHPRIVNISSGAGSHDDAAFGLRARGGAGASYGISKAALNALTSTLAAELAETPVLVNAVCPGLTATWPGAEEMGARPVQDSAAGVVWAATLPDDGPRGGLFRDTAPLPW